MTRQNDREAVITAIRLAQKAAIEEQDREKAFIDALTPVMATVNFRDNQDVTAEELAPIYAYDSQQSAKWLPDEIDGIDDQELRGALGIYCATMQKLEELRATRSFLEVLAECN